MNDKPKALWMLLKNYKFYNMCMFILFDAPHLTVGLKLILTQNEL
jgi:hypothetical protein